MLKNKLRYLILLATMGLLSILYNEYVMSIILLTILVIPFILFALLSYIFGMVSAELLSIVHVANKGEMIPISIQLNNPTIFPISNLTIYLAYKNAYSPKLYKKDFTVSLDRRTKTSVICNILSDYTGNLEIYIKGIRIYDYLKLFSLRKKLMGEVKVAVLPCFYEISQNYMTNRNRQMVESDYYSTIKGGDDPSEVFTIREYREGDRPQRIHWKLSIKQDQLMIKDFSDPLNCSVLVFVDLSIPKEEDALVYMDALLECSLSLSHSFVSQGQIHYLSWYDEKHVASRRFRLALEKDLFEAVDGLLQAFPYMEKTDALEAFLAEHPNDQYTDFFYVTGDVSEPERLASLSMIKAQARHIIYISDANHIIAENENNQHKIRPIPDEFIKRSDEMGIEFFSVDIGNIKADVEQLKLG